MTSVAMSIQAHILLVDDESAIIENLASFLECFGFEVKTALRRARPGKPPLSAD